MPLQRNQWGVGEEPTGSQSVGSAVKVLLALGQEQAKRKRLREQMESAAPGTKIQTTPDAEGYPVPTMERTVPTTMEKLLEDVFKSGLIDEGALSGARPVAPVADQGEAVVVEGDGMTGKPVRSRLSDYVEVGADGKPKFVNPADREKRELDRKKGLQDTTSPLRQEFTGRQEVKDYVTVAANTKSMDALWKAAQKGDGKSKSQLDQALIQMFNKILDPQSVVREAEYDRTPETLSLWNRTIGNLQRYAKGGAGLTDADRAMLVNTAKIVANSRGQGYNDVYGQFEGMAGKLGVDVDLVTGMRKPHADFALEEIAVPKGLPGREMYGGESSGMFQGGAVPRIVNPTTKEVRVLKDGQWVTEKAEGAK